MTRERLICISIERNEMRVCIYIIAYDVATGYNNIIIYLHGNLTKYELKEFVMNAVLIKFKY